MIAKRMRLFAGTAHPEFARKLGEHLGLTPDPSEAFHFTDGNLFVKIGSMCVATRSSWCRRSRRL